MIPPSDFLKVNLFIYVCILYLLVH
jgi:hypothetical protein